MLLYSPHYLFKRDVITVIASFEPPQSKNYLSVFVFHAYTFHLKEHRLPLLLTFAH